MSEHTSTPGVAQDPLAVVDQSMEFLNKTMDTFLSAASVDAVYGKPIQHGETVIIPAAEVISGMGFGIGGGGGTGGGDTGGGPAVTDEDEDPKETKDEAAANAGAPGGAGIGGGGGGRVFSRPVAVIIASPDGVRVEPVVDATKIALAMFTAFGFIFGMMARMRNPKRALAKMDDIG